MKLIKKTSLEQSSSIIDTLEWKISTIEEKGLPVESGLADYIAQAISNLENEDIYLKDVISQIKDRRNEIKQQLDNIKINGAEFIKSIGAEKLLGSAFCSSISINKGKESEEKEEHEEVFNLLITEDEAKELLIALGKAEIKKIISIKKTNYVPDKIRVNKKKIIDPEVVEEK